MPHDTAELMENLEVADLMAKFKMTYIDVVSLLLRSGISQETEQHTHTTLPTHCQDWGEQKSNMFYFIWSTYMKAWGQSHECFEYTSCINLRGQCLSIVLTHLKVEKK